jgi:hypothetical protein
MMNRVEALRRVQRAMGLFSREVVGVALWPFQCEWADYLLQTVAERRNEAVIVEMPRQSGKNETSAQVEVALLARFAAQGGAVVKCAPTWKPQIVNSKLRFEARARAVERKLAFLKFKPTMGYMYRCGQALIQFLSAAPDANVVGATASLLLEVDEAQDVSVAKFDKDFAPMRASTSAPMALYGTPWTDDTLLEQTKLAILEGRMRGRIFQVPVERVAAANPSYGEHVDAEVRRLGREHPLVKTQYFLELLAAQGRLLNMQQLQLMVGEHGPKEKRSGEKWIVAGLDFAGADEEVGEVGRWGERGRDSVALTVGEVRMVRVMEGLELPEVRMLARYEWTNVNPVSLHTTLYRLLWQAWKVDRVHCDATGIGATGTAFLAAALNKGGWERVMGVTFDSAWQTHTRLAFNYVAAVNGSRLLDYRPRNVETQDFASLRGQNGDPLKVARQPEPPTDVDGLAWWQRGHGRLRGRPGQRVKVEVPANEGHDDLLISELLLVDAALALADGRMSRVTTGGY